MCIVIRRQFSTYHSVLSMRGAARRSVCGLINLLVDSNPLKFVHFVSTKVYITIRRLNHGVSVSADLTSRAVAECSPLSPICPLALFTTTSRLLDDCADHGINSMTMKDLVIT